MKNENVRNEEMTPSARAERLANRKPITNSDGKTTVT